MSTFSSSEAAEAASAAASFTICLAARASASCLAISSLTLCSSLARAPLPGELFRNLSGPAVRGWGAEGLGVGAALLSGLGRREIWPASALSSELPLLRLPFACCWSRPLLLLLRLLSPHKPVQILTTIEYKQLKAAAVCGITCQFALPAPHVSCLCFCPCSCHAPLWTLRRAYASAASPLPLVEAGLLSRLSEACCRVLSHRALQAGFSESLCLVLLPGVDLSLATGTEGTLRCLRCGGPSHWSTDVAAGICST